MNYKEIVKDLKEKNLKKILVTGPHRGGTTFSGYALAQELNYLFYPEENISNGGLKRLKLFDKQHPKYVLQLPGFSHMCHLHEFDAVIFIKRNTEDVLNSMKRLSNKLIDNQTKANLKLLGLKESNLSLPELKLKAFKEIQMDKIKNSYILEYESWKDHEKYLPKSEREGFHIRQVTKK